MNGTWWTLGTVGILAAVGSARKRGSSARWRVDVTGRGFAGRDGKFFFDLDSSKFPMREVPAPHILELVKAGKAPWLAEERWITEREAAGKHAEALAQSGVEPPEGWNEWGTDDYEYQAEDTFLIPSIRNLKDKP
ncbi:hypothetical protein CMI47_00995 [Candidatus Pacearchaeota archaeon]|nr:hypothetical protein [Candidatus Pacearchaeota archaeon]|tara:strand:+ start:877 stop:1281 length:405 start_codon:yes stop_codon:yes gene_type:complete